MNESLFGNDPEKFAHDLFHTQKVVKRTFATVFVVWIVGVLLSLACGAGLIYVAVHFISKWW